MDQSLDCIGKLISTKNNRLKEQKGEISLWIITPTVSKRILNQFEAKPQENWGDGIYFLAPAFKTGIIVVHQLPKTKETLWLRLFGRDQIQLNAIAELESRPETYPKAVNHETDYCYWFNFFCNSLRFL